MEAKKTMEEALKLKSYYAGLKDDIAEQERAMEEKETEKRIKLFSDWGFECGFDTMEEANSFVKSKALELWEDCKKQIATLGRLAPCKKDLTNFEKCLARVRNFYSLKA